MTNHTLWNGNGGSDGKTGGKNGSCRVENGELGTGSDRKDKIRNEYVRKTVKIAKLGDKLWNARLCWYGHVKRREKDYVGKRMMEMVVPGRRKRGRPRRRWMDLVREDMERVEAREGDKVDQVKWRILLCCSKKPPPSREKLKEEEEEVDKR